MELAAFDLVPKLFPIKVRHFTLAGRLCLLNDYSYYEICVPTLLVLEILSLRGLRGRIYKGPISDQWPLILLSRKYLDMLLFKSWPEGSYHKAATSKWPSNFNPVFSRQHQGLHCCSFRAQILQNPEKLKPPAQIHVGRRVNIILWYRLTWCWPSVVWSFSPGCPLG